jgi:transcriptional regulator with XRE-family HTH domain
MKRSSYGKRDYAFGQAMLTLRTTVGLTHAELAEFLGVSRKAVGGWESGGSYPKAEHLKQFLTLCVRQHAFPAGREAEEIRALWHAAHQKLPLDEAWLAALLGRPRPTLTLLPPVPLAASRPDSLPAAQPPPGPQLEWGEALDVPTFYDREPELATLARWVVEEGCRLVSVLGMGGMGKSALVVRAMQQLAGHFAVVLFRSLRDAPDCSALLDDCLSVLSPQPLGIVPQSLERRLSLLLEELRRRRVLLVLDNLESLLEEGEVRGHLRPGFEAYGHLLRQVAQTAHQSCLLLTSREKPARLEHRGRDHRRPLRGPDRPVPLRGYGGVWQHH